MPWTTITAASSSGALPSTTYNAQVKGNLEHLADPPRTRARQDNAQTAFAASTWTSINFDAEDFDTMSAHPLTGNISRITPTQAGLYRVDGVAVFASDSTGIRRAAIAKNGTRLDGSVAYVPAGALSASLAVPSFLVYCNGSTDYLELQALHTASGSLATAVASEIKSMLQVCWAALT